MLSLRTQTFLTVALLLGACSGDDAQEPAGPERGEDGARGLRLIDAGSAPRFPLRMESLAPVSVSVAASSRTSGTVGLESFDDRADARYELEIQLDASVVAEEVVARFRPTIADATGSLAGSGASPWEWQLTRQGVLTEVDASAELPQDLPAEMFSTYALFLMAPDQPVGSGAVWTYADSEAGPPVEIRLEAIDANELRATISTAEEYPDARIDVAASGTWSRTSLIARRVSSRIDLSFTAVTTRNGEEVDVKLLRVIEHTYESEQ